MQLISFRIDELCIELEGLMVETEYRFHYKAVYC